MPIYDGVVTLAKNDIPVIVELDENIVRLSASGTEIGQWSKDECEIHHVADTTYAITAENDTLTFVPNQPSLFAAAVNGASPDARAELAMTSDAASTPGAVDVASEPPPAKPLTMGLFYALCVLTAALALWSLVSILLG